MPRKSSLLVNEIKHFIRRNFLIWVFGRVWVPMSLVLTVYFQSDGSSAPVVGTSLRLAVPGDTSLWYLHSDMGFYFYLGTITAYRTPHTQFFQHRFHIVLKIMCIIMLHVCYIHRACVNPWEVPNQANFHYISCWDYVDGT